MKGAPTEADAPRNVPNSPAFNLMVTVTPRPVTGSPHGTLEAPLPPCGASSFPEFADPGASFFSTQYESSLLIDDSCGGTWQREASDGGKLFRGFFFLGATSLLAL